MAALKRRLYEHKHPYYATEGNFFSTDANLCRQFDSWDDFMAEEGGADPELNFLYRWDWSPTDEGVLVLDLYEGAVLRAIATGESMEAPPKQVLVTILRDLRDVRDDAARLARLK